VIRLIATDLDGTVVRPDGSMSPRMVAALRAVEAAGLRLVIVTGRPPRWMHPVVEATGHRGTAVCGNGAFVYDLHAERITERFPLSVTDAAMSVQRVRSVLPRAAFAIETGEEYAHAPDYRPYWPPPPGTRVAPIEELLSVPIGKLLVRDDLTGDEMHALVEPVLAGIAQVTHSVGDNEGLIEVSAPGVTKAHTLQVVADEWGIDASEVVAFGDGLNDVEMLAWAGHSFAMADGHPAARRVSDATVASVAEDGVAAQLEALLSAMEN
jgi:hydroxymethylpyrimidine pyrophosphatase-like HAD family hydrolase